MSIISAGTSNTTSLVYTGDTTGAMVFQTNGTTEAMRITSGQQVGIGTSSPSGSVKLDVRDNSGFAAIQLAGTGVATAQFTSDSATNVTLKNVSNGALLFGTNNTERMRIAADGNVAVGNITSPSTQLHVRGAGSGTFGAYNDPLIIEGNSYTYLNLKGTNNQAGVIYNRNGSTGYFGGLDNNGGLKFVNMSTMNESGITNAKDSGTPSLLLTTSGNLLVNTTTEGGSTPGKSIVYYAQNTHWGMFINNTLNNSGAYAIGFGSGGNLVGRVETTASATSFVTSSDYRLKENIQPMTGALAKVAQLKPCTFDWKLDGTSSQGFIAHELAEVVPECVNGEKDAVNEDGSIKPQGVDTSFLVATLTAAIQELKAELDATKAEVAALKGNN